VGTVKFRRTLAAASFAVLTTLAVQDARAQERHDKDCPGKLSHSALEQDVADDAEIKAAEEDVASAQQNVDAARAKRSAASAALAGARMVSSVAYLAATQAHAAARAAGQAAIASNAAANNAAKNPAGGPYPPGIFTKALADAAALKAANAADAKAQAALAAAAKAEGAAQTQANRASERLGRALAILQAAQERLDALKGRVRERIRKSGEPCPPHSKTRAKGGKIGEDDPRYMEGFQPPEDSGQHPNQSGNANAPPGPPAPAGERGDTAHGNDYAKPPDIPQPGH
jgi:hypothetical protein